MTSESTYIHGTSPEEQRRLGVMNRILNAGSRMRLRLQPGESVIDFGCGLGQFTREMARDAAPGRVVGVERSEEQLAGAIALAREDHEESLVDFRRGDAAVPPLAGPERASFDVAHARFLLEHLVDPLSAVRAMVAAVKPGGRIILADDDHDVLRLWPEPPGLAELWRAYIRSYERIGNDPFIGRRLTSLLVEAGAQPRRNDWIFFGGCAGGDNFPDLVDNLHGILAGARETVLSHHLFEADYYDVVLGNLLAWSTRKDASFWFAMAWAEGIKPA
jgi:SAM-dependent methyltransferase